MIKEPIYRAVLSLQLKDAWKRIIEFSKEYSIKYTDKTNNVIVLDVSYPIRMLSYFTWAEGVTISLKSSSSNKTMITIYGKVLLSPHNLFRSMTLNKKKIDKNTFLSNVKIFFKKYELTIPDPIRGGSVIKSIFCILESFSLALFLLLIAQIVLFQARIDSPVVTISIILFLFSQAILIIWFSRECYSKTDLTNLERNNWITLIISTGFIGCFLFYRRFGVRSFGRAKGML